MDHYLRKPSLYPAELRDRSPAESRGRLEASYQSGRAIASLRSEPFMAEAFMAEASRGSHRLWANPPPAPLGSKTAWRDDAALRPLRRRYLPGGWLCSHPH
jgi:hypothetical protein